MTGKLLHTLSQVQMATGKYSKKTNDQGSCTRLGRPALPKELQRKNRVVTFLTDSQLDSLTAKAASKGISLSKACHDIISKDLG